MTTLNRKLEISAFSALACCIINTKTMYNLTNKFLPFETTKNNCPTNIGFLVHLLVFLAYSYLSMTKVDKPNLLKLNYAITGALLVNFAYSSGVIDVVGKAIGTLENGCLTTKGNIVHSIIYGILLLAIMYLPDC